MCNNMVTAHYKHKLFINHPQNIMMIMLMINEKQNTHVNIVKDPFSSLPSIENTHYHKKEEDKKAPFTRENLINTQRLMKTNTETAKRMAITSDNTMSYEEVGWGWGNRNNPPL